MTSATWNGVKIAESNETIMVEGNRYFPPDSVKKDYLRPSSTTSRCPWKGTADYYSLEVNGKTNRDAVWYYADPSAAATHIKGYLAFWNGVEVG